MSVSFIGMIGVSPEGGSSRVHVIDGGISPDFIQEFTATHEAAGFDLVLVGYSSGAADGLAVAQHAAQGTRRLKFLIAHRPGFVAPTLAARKFATLDQLTGGRVAVHVITGGSDRDQAADGDHLPKADRYRRSGEYMQVLRRAWTAEAPFDHAGEFYQCERVFSQIKPLQAPHPKLFFGGSSPEAAAVGGAQADVYALFGEPRAAIAERMADIRRHGDGREIQFSVSLRPIIADTEAAAWDKARAILDDIQTANGDRVRRAMDASGERMLGHAARQDVHDERLWMGIARATGAVGNTSCLVGTPDQVAESLAAYHALGVGYFLLRGFDPEADAAEYGRELLPRVRALVGD